MKRQGFTLIEVLLVIVILAVITSMGINMYRRHAQAFRVDKIAIEMQHVVEAALSYNVHNSGNWPAPASSPATDLCNGTTPIPTGNSFIDDYIPNGQYGVESSLGTNFCWDQHSGTQRFWVALKLPNADTTLGNQIKAQLPNSVLTSDPTVAGDVPPDCTSAVCYIRAEVTDPGASSEGHGSAGLYIAGMGACVSPKSGVTNPVIGSSPDVTCQDVTPGGANYNEYQVNFTCPAGKTGMVLATPNFMNAPITSGDVPFYVVKLLTSADGDVNHLQSLYPCHSTDGKTQQCELYLMGSAYQQLSDYFTAFNGYVGASYIGFCK